MKLNNVASLVEMMIFVTLLTSLRLEALQQINAPYANPEVVGVATPTTVLVTVQAEADASLLPASVNLIRKYTSGQTALLGRMYDDGTHGDKLAGDFIFTIQIQLDEADLGTVNLAATAAYSGRRNRVSSLYTSIKVDPTVGPQGGTVTGPGEVSVTFPPNAASQSIPVSIAAVTESDVGKQTPPGFVFLGAVNLNIGNTVLNDNADISVPVPSNVPTDAEIYVAELVQYAGAPMFMLVDTAQVQGGNIVSQDPGFPGIITGGIYCFFWGEHVGWVGGQVMRLSDGSAVAGAVVTLSGGYFLAIADGLGMYSLPAWAGNFVVVAFDDQTGDHGEQQGFMPSGATSVTANVQVGESQGPVQQDLVNGDFETGDLTGWVPSGEAGVITALGEIQPARGTYMGYISSGGNAVGGASSALEQSFKVPAGVTTLKLRFNFVSEEYDEYVGSDFNDVFNATLVTPTGSREIAFADVNGIAWKGWVYGIPDSFVTGDNTWGETGWLEATIDVSEYAGTDDTLTLTVHDVGDTIYTTIVLLDWVRFYPRKGVDYSFNHPNPDGQNGLSANGYDFAIRYVGGSGAPKDLTLSEAETLQAAGIDIIVVFESTDKRMLDGYDAGVADANTAVTVAVAAGAPADFFCYFACDFDAQESQQVVINDYLRGAADALGGIQRVGFYGGYGPVSRVLDAGKATRAWQTAAWSYGKKDPRISLYQHAGQMSIAGGICDINDGFSDDLGQW